MRRLFTALTLSSLALASNAQQNFDAVEVQAQQVAEGIYMLTGAGGNIGLSVGDDATFMIDDQYMELTGKIQATVAQLTDMPVKFLLNTHIHFDHTGGNESFGKAGAIIIAHDNVRKVLSQDQYLKAFDRQIPAAPKAALPVVSFDNTLTLHLNGHTITGIHVPNAHTDGDTIVHFVEANVLHMGDTFFNGLYPFIDAQNGGSIDGMIGAADAGLLLSDEATKIIPGHGALASRSDLQAVRNMLKSVLDRIAALIKEGKSVAEIQAAKPTREFDEKFNAAGFFEPDRWVELVYQDMTR